VSGPTGTPAVPGGLRAGFGDIDDASPTRTPACGSSAGVAPVAAVTAWLERCRALAEAQLDGIEDAALELAALAEGDRGLMERARRVLLDDLERRPGDRTLVQMQWFWRRAFEKGTWDWDDAWAAPGSAGGSRL
jgi:hypothetical protein